MDREKRSFPGSSALVFLVAFLSMVAILSAPLVAHADPPRRYSFRDERFWNLEEIVRDLDLSKTQRRRVRAILRNFREREKAKKKELERLLERTDRRDRWRNDSLQERIEDLTADLISLHYRRLNRIYKILDRDQRRKLKWKMDRLERRRYYLYRRWEKEEDWKDRKEYWKEYREYLKNRERYRRYLKRLRIPGKEMNRIVIWKEYPYRRARSISREQAKIMVKVMWEYTDIDLLIRYIDDL